jgi:hypothetical protein
VPPQRHDWWAEDAATKAILRSRLPQEIIDMIVDNTESWPMGIDEAESVRLEMKAERKRAERNMMLGDTDIYRFCDH